MTRRASLDAIRYDEDLLRGFVSDLSQYGEVEDVKLTAKWEGGQQDFDSVDDLLKSTFVPDKIRNFDIEVRAKEGRVKVIANSTGGRSTHRYRISGEDQWMDATIQRIEEFNDRRRNVLRTYFSKWVFFGLYGFFAGIFIESIGQELLGMAVPMLYPAISDTQIIFGTLGLVGFISVYFFRLTWPYVILLRGGKETLMQKSKRGIPVIVTLLAGVITIYKFLSF